MKMGFLLPTFFASSALFPNRIFAPKLLARDTIDGLVKNGHEVFVFSTPDFETKGTLIPGDISYQQKNLPYFKLRNEHPGDRSVRTDEVLKRNFELSVTAQAFAYDRKHQLEIIHSYHDFVFTPHYFEEVAQIPTVYTLHDPLPPENSFEYAEFQKFSAHCYVSISMSQQRSSLKLNFVNTVYHGIQLDDFPFQAAASDYILFMGRLVPEKGLHSAIDVAISENIRLEIGTQFPDHEKEDSYFVTKVKPFLENPLIAEPGMVNGADKLLLYKQARALLFPIEWEEPFGMVMIEAMACGTPVIAYNRGSVAEVVKDGVTGFIIDPDDAERPGKGNWIIKKSGIAGLTDAGQRISEIDRVACRRHVEEKFTVAQMVKGYEAVYLKAL